MGTRMHRVGWPLARRIAGTLLVVLGLAPLAGCGDEDITALLNEVGPPVNIRYHVSAGIGSDTNDGSMATPFRSITKALTLAVAGEGIKVHPGLYDAANGESFPLTVPTGVALIGDEPAKGNGAPPTTVQGPPTGDVIGPGNDTLVAGLRFVTNGGNVASVFAPNVIFRNNTFNAAPAGDGLWLWGDGYTVVANRFSGLSNGMVVVGGPNILVAGNQFTGNSLGVSRESSGGADFGGGAMGSPGGNVFSCNASTDLRLYTGTAQALFNAWDHLPPTSQTGTGTGGVDVALASGAIMPNTAGGVVAPGFCP